MWHLQRSFSVLHVYPIMGVYVWYFVVYIYILKTSIAISIYSDAQYRITRFIYMYMYILIHVLQVTRRSTDNRGPMTEERYLLLLKVLQGNPNKEPIVETFASQNKKSLYTQMVTNASLILSLGRI